MIQKKNIYIYIIFLNFNRKTLNFYKTCFALISEQFLNLTGL